MNKLLIVVVIVLLLCFWYKSEHAIGDVKVRMVRSDIAGALYDREMEMEPNPAGVTQMDIELAKKLSAENPV